MLLNNETIEKENLPQAFANHFQYKIKTIIRDVKIDTEVYNGINKVLSASENFMTELKIIECIKSIKIKNNEGFDRIPQRILVDGLPNLLPPLVILFEQIYLQKKYPNNGLCPKLSQFSKRVTKTQLKITDQFPTYVVLLKSLRN